MRNPFLFEPEVFEDESQFEDSFEAFEDEYEYEYEDEGEFEFEDEYEFEDEGEFEGDYEFEDEYEGDYEFEDESDYETGKRRRGGGRAIPRNIRIAPRKQPLRVTTRDHRSQNRPSAQRRVVPAWRQSSRNRPAPRFSGAPRWQRPLRNLPRNQQPWYLQRNRYAGYQPFYQNIRRKRPRRWRYRGQTGYPRPNDPRFDNNFGSAPQPINPSGDSGSQSPQDSSESIRVLQSLLNRVLGLNLPVDGTMNVETRSAIRSFLSQKDPPANGAAGPPPEPAPAEPVNASQPGGATEEPQGEYDEFEFYDNESDYSQSDYGLEQFGGIPFNPVSRQTCPAYQRDEVATSRTSKGHLPSDVIEHNRGLLIADFGVNWRTPKQSIKNDPVLKNWFTTIVQKAHANASTKIHILGFSDCVGNERNNSLLRRGRALRVYKLLKDLGNSRQWNDLRKRITFSAAPVGDYVADNSTVESRSKNRSVLIEVSSTVSFDDPDVVTVTLPDTIQRIIKRGLELIQQPDKCGLRITKHQQQRIQCILMSLSKPGVDDRYLTGQGILDFMNNTYYSNDARYSLATQWLLPEYVVKSREKRTDRDICIALLSIDQNIIAGRALINRFIYTQGEAVSRRILLLRDWMEKQQNNTRSIYSCYT